MQQQYTFQLHSASTSNVIRWLQACISNDRLYFHCCTADQTPRPRGQTVASHVLCVEPKRRLLNLSKTEQLIPESAVGLHHRGAIPWIPSDRPGQKKSNSARTDPRAGLPGLVLMSSV